MNITRKKILVAVLVGIAAGVLALQFIGRPMFVTWLRAHSTVRMVQPLDARYSIAVYRYPRLGDIPEFLGFGQGYVQLYDTATEQVLQEKVAEDLAAIRTLSWGASSVTISGFVEWEVPGWYQARN